MNRSDWFAAFLWGAYFILMFELVAALLMWLF